MQGEANRMVAEHQLNRESSRSHTIFSIMLERSAGAEGDEVITSKLNLVDLAGSERISKTKSEGTVLKEAQQINKSLSFLEQVTKACIMLECSLMWNVERHRSWRCSCCSCHMHDTSAHAGQR